MTLTEYRARKQAEKFVTDLEAMLQVFHITASALDGLQKYVPARDVLLALADSATLAQVYLNKYRKVLESPASVD